MKAQGATEYLVLVGVALLLASVIIGILVWPTGSTSDVKQSQKDISLGIGKIAYPELSDALSAYYKFDEGTGNKAYNSAGRNVYDSTLINEVGWTDGIRGKAASFDGSDDYASFSPGSSTRCTLSAWIKAGSQAGPEFIGNILGGNGIDNYVSAVNTVGFRMYDGTAWRNGGSLPEGSWIHIAFTFDGSTRDLYMYKNGVGTYYGNSSTYSNCNPYAIGTYSIVSPSRLLNASLDDLHYYKRVLSPYEIELLYKNPGYP